MATLASVYFNVVATRIKKIDVIEVETTIDELLKCLVKGGLKESVTFTKEDFLDTYSRLFSSGSMSLKNINMLTRYGFDTSASHLERAPTYYNDLSLGTLRSM